MATVHAGRLSIDSELTMKIEVELIGATTYVPVNGRVKLPSAGEPKRQAEQVLTVKTADGYKVTKHNKTYFCKTLSEALAV